MTMRRISHLLLSHKRMNRYLLDVDLCKHKKLWEEIFSFSCLRSAKFKYTRIEQSSQMGEIDERMRQWASNWIYLSPVSKQYRGKNNDISLLQTRKLQSPHHPPYRKYLHPKKFYRNHSNGEDLSYRQFCRLFKSAVRMIIGKFEKPRVYFEVISANIPK